MATHEELWKICRDTEAYRQGTDTNQHELPDCSCGCKFFHPLAGEAGNDWGICSCLESPRAGLLTFEHMSCKCWKAE